jgi:DNA-binding response OmpR family regulator
MAKTLLVIDDEPDIMDVVTVRLRHLGHEIIQAISAEEALAVLKNKIPDLILLDLLLPKMHGDEFCKKIKADKKYKQIPVILFTANVLYPGPAEKMKTMGADDYIVKPFEPEELLGKVKKMLNLKIQGEEPFLDWQVIPGKNVEKDKMVRKNSPKIGNGITPVSK